MELRVIIMLITICMLQIMDRGIMAIMVAITLHLYPVQHLETKIEVGKTTTTNIGLDVSIFNSRVNLSVDWYNNESSNLLIKNKIPTSTGYTHQFQNIGSIRNRGVELV